MNMKKMLTLVAYLLIVVATQAQTLQSLFDKYSEDERFTAVTVGGGMMNLGSIIGKHSSNSQNKELASKMKSIKILTLEDKGSVLSKTFIQELDKVIEDGKFITAIEARDKGERVHIYYRLSGKDNADMLIVSKDKNEISLIWISGKMSKEEMLNAFSCNGKSTIREEKSEGSVS